MLWMSRKGERYLELGVRIPRVLNGEGGGG